MAEMLSKHARAVMPELIDFWSLKLEGLDYTTNGTLIVPMNPGVVYLGRDPTNDGARVEHTAASLAQLGEDTHTFTASKDTYVGLNRNGDFEFQEVNNMAAEPTPSSGYVHYLKVVTDATQLTAQDVLIPLLPIFGSGGLGAGRRLYTAEGDGSSGQADKTLFPYAYRVSYAIARQGTGNMTWGPLLAMPASTVLIYRASVSGFDQADVSDVACRHMSGNIYRVGSGTPVNTLQADNNQNGTNLGNFSLSMGADGTINVTTEQGAITTMLAAEITGQLLQIPA